MSSQSSTRVTFRPERLSEEIDRAMLTNAEVAARMGVTEKTVWRWRNDTRFTPRKAHIRRMAELFDCEPHSFVYEPLEDAA